MRKFHDIGWLEGVLWRALEVALGDGSSRVAAGTHLLAPRFRSEARYLGVSRELIRALGQVDLLFEEMEGGHISALRAQEVLRAIRASTATAPQSDLGTVADRAAYELLAMAWLDSGGPSICAPPLRAILLEAMMELASRLGRPADPPPLPVLDPATVALPEDPELSARVSTKLTELVGTESEPADDLTWTRDVWTHPWFVRDLEALGLAPDVARAAGLLRAGWETGQERLVDDGLALARSHMASSSGQPAHRSQEVLASIEAFLSKSRAAARAVEDGPALTISHPNATLQVRWFGEPAASAVLVQQAHLLPALGWGPHRIPCFRLGCELAYEPRRRWLGSARDEILLLLELAHDAPSVDGTGPVEVREHAASREPDAGLVVVAEPKGEHRSKILGLTVDGPGPLGALVDLRSLVDLVELRATLEPGASLPATLGHLERLTLVAESSGVSSLPAALPALRTLRLGGWAGTGSLPQAPELRTLELFCGDAATLGGLERCTSITRLRVSDFKNLRDVSMIELLSSLQQLEFFGCPTLEDLEPISRCRELQSITIVGVPHLQSVAFVRHLERLESFTCELSTIRDGDLTPLLQVSALQVEHHRHYSHRPSELEAARRGHRG